MNRMFMQRRTPLNIFGMPTTLPQEEMQGPASNESMISGEYVPPEELTRPTGAYLGNMTPPPQTQNAGQEPSTMGKISDILSKVGNFANTVNQNYWSQMGGPKGDAARANKEMDLKTLLASMKTAAGTNDIQNYKFYADQEKQSGKTPMSFYRWRESLNKAGAGGGGKEPVDPYFKALEVAILKKAGERLGVGSEEVPSEGTASGGMSEMRGVRDLGGGVKINFGGG